MTTETKPSQLPAVTQAKAELTAPAKLEEAKALAPRPLENQHRGMSEKPLDREATAILCAPTKDDEVELRIDVRRDGSVSGEFLYAPHARYRDRFNRAVGPMAWALHQDAAPMMDSRDGMVYWTGTLYVQGRYVGSAVGQQRYVPGNSRMSYADAVEGAKSDCLTRTSKDLGMFWELWVPSWRAGWYERNVDRVRAAREALGVSEQTAHAAGVPEAAKEETARITITELPPSEEKKKDNGATFRIYRAKARDAQGKDYLFSTFSATNAKSLKHAHENGLEVRVTYRGPNKYGECEIRQIVVIDGPEREVEA